MNGNIEEHFIYRYYVEEYVYLYTNVYISYEMYHFIGRLISFQLQNQQIPGMTTSAAATKYNITFSQ